MQKSCQNNSTVFLYTNRLGDLHYLHQRTSQKGTACFYFSKKNNGDLVKMLPNGYEVWEHPETSQVFLRKKLPQIITKIEEGYLYHSMEKLNLVNQFRIDIQKNKIMIYQSWNAKGLMEVFSSMREFLPKDSGQLDLDNLINRFGNYQATLRFTLVDAEKRLFFAERLCFRESIDDWTTIYSMINVPLEILCEALLPHLEKESYYTL